MLCYVHRQCESLRAQNALEELYIVEVTLDVHGHRGIGQQFLGTQFAMDQFVGVGRAVQSTMFLYGKKKMVYYNFQKRISNGNLYHYLKSFHRREIPATLLASIVSLAILHITILQY